MKKLSLKKASLNDRGIMVAQYYCCTVTNTKSYITPQEFQEIKHSFKGNEELKIYNEYLNASNDIWLLIMQLRHDYLIFHKRTCPLYAMKRSIYSYEYLLDEINSYIYSNKDKNLTEVMLKIFNSLPFIEAEIFEDDFIKIGDTNIPKYNKAYKALTNSIAKTKSLVALINDIQNNYKLKLKPYNEMVLDIEKQISERIEEIVPYRIFDDKDTIPVYADIELNKDFLKEIRSMMKM